MTTTKMIVEQRKQLGWGEIDEMIEWLNPEDPARDVKKRDSLARYLHFSQNNMLRGYFGLPCLLCHDHAVPLSELVKDRESYGWDDQFVKVLTVAYAFLVRRT